jgi:hypothetical protein
MEVSAMTASRLKVEGQTLWRGDTRYEEARRSAVWNEKKPDRFPEMIVTVASELDVVKAVGFALFHKMKIAVRAGGYSWVGSPIRDGGMLIDLSRLHDISIEPRSRIARVQPAVTGGELASALGEHRLPLQRRDANGPRQRFPRLACGACRQGGRPLCHRVCRIG